MAQTSTARWQFVIRFVQMDLDTLRPGALLTLQEDVMAFLGWDVEGSPIPHKGGTITMPLGFPYPRDYVTEDFRALQEEVRSVVHAIVDRGDMTGPGITTKEIHARYAIISPSMRRTSGQETILQVTGPTRDLFLLTLFGLLNQEPFDRLLRCPECGTIFYRIGKQKYCARACVNRANVRQWRQHEEHKQQEQERAHQRYKAKTTKQSQGNVVIKRRQRKGEPTPA